jgi:ABC-type nitrate/sulfonate/bicarbonate transport system ATPase subunit
MRKKFRAAEKRVPDLLARVAVVFAYILLMDEPFAASWAVFREGWYFHKNC